MFEIHADKKKHVNNLYNRIPPIYKNSAKPNIFLKFS
jgi:hypothetical protein